MCMHLSMRSIEQPYTTIRWMQSYILNSTYNTACLAPDYLPGVNATPQSRGVHRPEGMPSIGEVTQMGQTTQHRRHSYPFAGHASACCYA